MFNHEPESYVCPFCSLIKGVESRYDSIDDIVFQNQYVTASIAPKWWERNHGHVLVMPNTHYENIYDTPDEVIAEIYKVVKKMSVAIRSTYNCEGTSTRQHNEPAGGQDVWHLHVHVFPRYVGDRLYEDNDKSAFYDASNRKLYADQLKAFLREK